MAEKGGKPKQDAEKVLRAFLGAILKSRGHTDVVVAAGAALQDLDEIQGIATYEEPA